MKQVITKADVEKAINDLKAQGKKTTLGTIHAALDHRGSITTVMNLRNEIEAASLKQTHCPEAIKAFQEVWALAVEEGRKQQQGIIAGLQEDLKTLGATNDTLSGEASAANARANEFGQIKASLEERLASSQAALAEAGTQAADALKKLVETQEVSSSQVATLQAELKAAVQMAHDFELQLARALAHLEAKGVQPSVAEAAQTAPAKTQRSNGARNDKRT